MIMLGSWINCQIAFYMLYLARHVIVKLTWALELGITF